ARQDRAGLADGDARRALRAAGARGRQHRPRPRAEAVLRTRGVRPCRHAVRRREGKRARRARRDARAIGCRPVRRDDVAARCRPLGRHEGGRMNSMTIHIRREFWEHRSLWIAPVVWVSIITLLFAWLIFVVIPNEIGHHGMVMGPDAQTMSQLDEKDRKE